MKNKNKRKDGKNTKVKHTMKHPHFRGLKSSHSKSNLYTRRHKKSLECEYWGAKNIIRGIFTGTSGCIASRSESVYNVLNSVEEAKAVGKVHSSVRLQQQLGVERNTISFSIVMSAAIKGKKPKYALELFAEMKIGLDITTITINVAMQAHLKLNEPNKALELFDALEEKDTVSLNTAMAAAE